MPSAAAMFGEDLCIRELPGKPHRVEAVLHGLLLPHCMHVDRVSCSSGGGIASSTGAEGTIAMPVGGGGVSSA